MYMYIYICMYVCMYMYMYMYMCIYVYDSDSLFSGREFRCEECSILFGARVPPPLLPVSILATSCGISHSACTQHRPDSNKKKKNRTDNVPDWRGGKLLPLLCFPRSLSPEPTLKSQIKSSPLVTHHLIKPPPPPSSLSLYIYIYAII